MRSDHCGGVSHGVSRFRVTNEQIKAGPMAAQCSRTAVRSFVGFAQDIAQPVPNDAGDVPVLSHALGLCLFPGSVGGNDGLPDGLAN